MTADTSPPAPPTVRSGRRWAFGLVVMAVVAAGAGVATQPWARTEWVTSRLDSWADRGASSAMRSALAAQLAADSLAAASAVAPDGGAAPADLATAVRTFYAARDGAPAWTDGQARAAALDALARADRDGIPVSEALPDSLAALATAAPTSASDSLLARLDTRLTAAVLHYGRLLREPRVDAGALYGTNAWEPTAAAPHDPRPDAEALARALAAAPDPNAALEAFVREQRPPHEGYARLQAALAREMDLAARPDLVLSADVAPADSGAAVQRLQERLEVERLDSGTPGVYDEALAAAVRTYQALQGLRSTGRVDTATRDSLNRRQPEAIPLLALNLERWRWLPERLGSLHVLVNIPAFEMAVRERRGGGDRWAEVFRSPVVVGKPSWATPVFSDTMESVVFNPTWTMPASIQRESYGRLRPDRAVVPPGPRNALGRVKFLFPNHHSVYFHDTPSTWGFTVERRALSHGCVRSGDPQGLAEALLTRTNGWTKARVDSVMTGPWRLQEVRLDRPVPVHLVYFTATADAAGRVTTFPDVYNRDERLAEKLNG